MVNQSSCYRCSLYHYHIVSNALYKGLQHLLFTLVTTLMMLRHCRLKTMYGDVIERYITLTL